MSTLNDLIKDHPKLFEEFKVQIVKELSDVFVKTFDSQVKQLEKDNKKLFEFMTRQTSILNRNICMTMQNSIDHEKKLLKNLEESGFVEQLNGVTSEEE